MQLKKDVNVTELKGWNCRKIYRRPIKDRYAIYQLKGWGKGERIIIIIVIANIIDGHHDHRRCRHHVYQNQSQSNFNVCVFLSYIQLNEWPTCQVSELSRQVSIRTYVFNRRECIDNIQEHAFIHTRVVYKKYLYLYGLPDNVWVIHAL